MNWYLTCDLSRRIDQWAIQTLGFTGRVLMENAGRGCADAIQQRPVRRACILCGTGNNGGDGLVIARHLALSGVTCNVMLCGSPGRLSPDAAANYRIAKHLGLSIQDDSDTAATDLKAALIAEQRQLTANPESAVIVDALLGTGSRGAPRGVVGAAIEWANRQPVRRIAIDLPSGFDADTGEIESPTFLADETLTMVAPKLGFKHRGGRPPLGRITTIGIGFPAEAARQALAAMPQSPGDAITDS